MARCDPRLDHGAMALQRRARAHRELPQTPAHPIVKWVGGKTKLLPELLARMPERYGRYYEAFAGGAALFFRVAPKRAVLADMNADLIVAGAYGHSHLREIFLGGVTQTLLDKMTIPLLMAH